MADEPGQIISGFCFCALAVAEWFCKTSGFFLLFFVLIIYISAISLLVLIFHERVLIFFGAGMAEKCTYVMLLGLSAMLQGASLEPNSRIKSLRRSDTRTGGVQWLELGLAVVPSVQT